MHIVWSGSLLGDLLVASLNSGCLSQLKIQSSLPLQMINSAHAVDGLPIIVSQLVLIGRGFPDVEFIMTVETSPSGSN